MTRDEESAYHALLLRELNDVQTLVSDLRVSVNDRLVDLRAEAGGRTILSPVEVEARSQTEPLQPENPDEEAPISDDSSSETRRTEDPSSRVFVLTGREPLDVGDRLRVFSSYRGEVAHYQVGRLGTGGLYLYEMPVGEP